MGEKGLQNSLRKPLLEEIYKGLGERGKEGERTKRNSGQEGKDPQCLARGFFKSWLSHARSVSTRYPVASTSSEKSYKDHLVAEGAEKRAQRCRACGCGCLGRYRQMCTAAGGLLGF